MSGILLYLRSKNYHQSAKMIYIDFITNTLVLFEKNVLLFYIDTIK